jgi:hypothetical protein
MAKNKKAAASSSYGKKKTSMPQSKKVIKKAPLKMDSRKVEAISEKITKINNNFESLIKECQTALKQLTAATPQM